MISLLKEILAEVKVLKWYLLLAIGFIILSFSTYLLSDSIINKLGDEDGFFENATTLFFFLSAVFFLIIFIYKKHLMLLLFSFIYFVGAGEEISWGQRIFNYKTPEQIEKENVQKELNLHNLSSLNEVDLDGKHNLLSVNFLYRLFWLGYGIVLPLMVSRIKFVKNLVAKIKIPVPPITIGFLFMVNWMIFRFIKFMLHSGKSAQYYDSVGEISECNSAFIFFIISLILYHVMTKKSLLLNPEEVKI